MSTPPSAGPAFSFERTLSAGRKGVRRAAKAPGHRCCRHLECSSGPTCYGAGASIDRTRPASATSWISTHFWQFSALLSMRECTKAVRYEVSTDFFSRHPVIITWAGLIQGCDRDPVKCTVSRSVRGRACARWGDSANTLRSVALRSATQALCCPPRTRPRASDRYDAGPTAWTHSGHFDAAPEQIAPMHTGSSQLASRLPSYALATQASVRRRTPSCNSRAQDHTTRGRTRWPCPLPFTSKGRQPCPLPFRAKGRQPSRWGAYHPRAYPVALPTTLHLEGAAALPTTLPHEGATTLPLGSRPPALPDHIHPCAAERAPRRAARASDLQRTHRGGARRTRTQKRHGGRRGEHGRNRERSLGSCPTRCGH